MRHGYSDDFLDILRKYGRIVVELQVFTLRFCARLSPKISKLSEILAYKTHLRAFTNTKIDFVRVNYA